MFKPFTIPLAALLLLSSVPSHAQSNPAPSCSSVLKKMTEKKGNGTTLLAGGVGAIVGTTAASIFILPAGSLFFLGFGVGIVIKGSVDKHRENILDILEGSATPAGNRRTKKLWKIAKRQNPEVFKTVSYEQFLEAIHKADLSGEACKYERVPERKDIVKVIVHTKDLEESPLGEKTKSPRASVNQEIDFDKLEQVPSFEIEAKPPKSYQQ